MSNMFPTAILAFNDLIAVIGDDPCPLPEDPAGRDYILEKRRQRLMRAREIYERGSVHDPKPIALVSEFVTCFGEFHQPHLYRPFEACWRGGMWHDLGFGLLLRALMEQGGHTSALLNELTVTELIGTIRLLPKSCLMAQHELEVLDQLPPVVDIFRGGWGVDADDVVCRGISWSLAEGVAEEFIEHNIASFEPGQRPFHLRGAVAKADILIYIDGEFEVITTPGKVANCESVSSPMTRRFQSFAQSHAS